MPALLLRALSDNKRTCLSSVITSYYTPLSKPGALAPLALGNGPARCSPAVVLELLGRANSVTYSMLWYGM
eukprot:5117251-Heterocapsa_arctica.AAC.1